MERERVEIDLSAFPEEDVLDLKDWLENSDVPGLYVKETYSEPRENVMGVEWVPVLVAFLSAPAVVALANAVRDWLKYRKKKLHIEMTQPDGTKIVVDAENISTRKAVELVNSMK